MINFFKRKPKIVYVDRFKDLEFPQHKTDKLFLHQLSKSQELCPELYVHFVQILKELEDQYHFMMPVKNADQAIQQAVEKSGLLESIKVMKKIINTPGRAAAVLRERKKDEIETFHGAFFDEEDENPENE